MQIRCRHNAAKLKGSCDAGETAVSVPIYFLPGMLCDRRQWEPVWACLQAIVPKGSCHAEWFDFHAADDASMTSFAQEVADRAVKAPGIVAGFSMGGHVAFELYRQCPEAIRGLLLCNTSAELDPPHRREDRERFLALPVDAGRFDGITKSEWPKYVAQAQAENWDMLALVQSMAAGHGMAGAQAQARALIHRQESFDTLATMALAGLPVRICAGVEDQVTTLAQAERMVSAMGSPLSDIVQLHSGHMGPLEAPDAIATTLAKILVAIA